MYIFLGHFYEVTTLNSNSFNKAWFYPKKEKFTFDVAACNDVTIAMSMSPYSLDKAYSARFGANGNRRHWIKTRYQVKISQQS